MDTEPDTDRPWILLPGTLCTGQVFDAFLDPLNVPGGMRQVIDLDSPRIEDYAGRLAALSDARAVLCGFSLGAIVAAHLVDRIKVAECLFFGLNPRADDPAKRPGRLDLAQDVAQQGGAAALAPRLGALAGPDPEGARARILAMADASAPRIDAQTRLALERQGALDVLARAAMPVTLLTGTNDTMAPMALAHEAAQATPRGQVAPLEGLGHYALVEDPIACARAVAGHWARRSGQQRKGSRE